MSEPATPQVKPPLADSLPVSYSVAEVAQYFGCTKASIADAIIRGELKAGRVAKKHRILASSIVEWLSRTSP